MNDPHVEALIYRLSHGDGFEYKNASRLERDFPRFRVTIEGKEARFELKEHHSDVDDARAVLEPFIRSWELDAALTLGPESFGLRFDHPILIDRNPTAGVVHLVGSEMVLTAGTVSIQIGMSTFPEPVVDLLVDRDVEAMSTRFARYQRGQDTLPSVAYFCLTVLVDAAGGNRRDAGRKFGVSRPVLDTLARLSTEHGGSDARKSLARGKPYTANEQAWLGATLRRLIRRAAEVASDPARNSPDVTMAELPAI